MKIRAAFFCAALCVPLFSIRLFSQQPPPPPPPQTARQALIEMITGGQKAVNKHLTVEVQQLLVKAGGKSVQIMSVFDSVRSQLRAGAQIFDSGPVLLAMNPPASTSSWRSALKMTT